MEFEIGSRLKELRKTRKMSIADLAAKSEVSTGLISQIERDKVIPSVVNLYRIAKALDTDVNYFFESTPKQQIQITRRGNHKQIITEQGNVTYELFTSSRRGHVLDFMKITLKGGEEYSREMISHEGEECGYVLKGVLTVLLDGTKYELNEGDSIYYNSSIPHKYLNLEEEECISVWAMTPTFF